jgi:prolyl 4-hydroxylase
MIKKICFLLLLNIAFVQAEPITQLSESPRIFLLKGFLSGKECDYIIKLAQPNLIASQVVDEQNAGEATDRRRTSRGFFLSKHRNDRILNRIEKHISSITGLPIENGEDLHVLHYGIGGEYQPHFDYFNPATPGGADCLRRGGQRVASVIMYLNTPEAGGETIFPRAKISITPTKGDAVLFYNCTPSGIVDPNSFHGGAPVKGGEKWIMTKWIRERAFY